MSVPDTTTARPTSETRLVSTGVRRLTPDIASIFEGTFSLLHCAVKPDSLFRGVFAVRLFPIRYPEKFISLLYTGTDDKDKEIGVIEDLSTFPKAQQELVARSLASHYYEKIIRRVHGIRYEFGLLFFDVETQRGREDFVMPWRGDRAEDYGEKGKVLLDALDNRFIIPNLDDLPAADRNRFVNYIYW